MGGSGSRNITPSPQVTTETDTITDYVISQTSKRWISFLLIDKTNGVCMEQTQLIYMDIYIFIHMGKQLNVNNSMLILDRD